jgi:uncharacterized protein
MRMRVAVTGSSGLVGRALCAALVSRGDEVLPVLRHSGKQASSGDCLWNPEGPSEATALPEGTDAVVHLAGAPIAAKRWTDSYKMVLSTSRIEGSRVLVDAIERLKTKPAVLISASALSVYGEDSDRILNESNFDESQITNGTLEPKGPGTGFLTELARGWEREVFRARAVGVERVVAFRIGLALDPAGGALGKMLPIFRLGLGGTLGNGKQWMSWILLDDLVRALLFALDNQALDGPANLISPEACTNKVFTRALGRVLRRPAIFPVPAFLLRLVTSGFADEALLVSNRAVPAALTNAGFQFECEDLEQALRLAVL